MAKSTSGSRRQSVEPGIYTRTNSKGEKVFEIGFRDADGKQRWRTVQGGIRAARARLTEEKARSSRGERIAANPRLTLNEAADAWWNTRVVNLRPNTHYSYRSNLTHIRPFLGRQRLTAIMAPDLVAYVAHRKAEGAKGWTIRGELIVVSSIFKFASRHLGFAGQNPVSTLDSSERPSTDDQKPKRILNEIELAQLIEATADERYRRIFKFASETGARLGEVLGLLWGNVDFEKETVTFIQQLDRNQHLAPLKTARSRRTLEITPGLATMLREMKLAAADSTPYGFVFTTKRGTPYDQRNVARAMERSAKLAGFEAVVRDGRVIDPVPTFHNFRHTHGSALIAAGWDIEEVSSRLGHANVAVTQKIYIHAYDAARRSQSRRDRLAQLYAPETPEVAQVVNLR